MVLKVHQHTMRSSSWCGEHHWAESVRSRRPMAACRSSSKSRAEVEARACSKVSAKRCISGAEENPPWVWKLYSQESRSPRATKNTSNASSTVSAETPTVERERNFSSTPSIDSWVPRGDQDSIHGTVRQIGKRQPGRRTELSMGGCGGGGNPPPGARRNHRSSRRRRHRRLILHPAARGTR